MRRSRPVRQHLSSITSKDTRTTNGALTNSSTGSALVDQFGTAGQHRGRSFADVSADMSRIYGNDKLSALRFAFYLRLITRKIKGSFVTDKVQMGQGNRDESFKRLLWVAKHDPISFYENLWLLPIVGSWKDLWAIMMLANELGIPFNYNKVFDLIASAIKDDNERPLIQKFLPQIKSSTKCKTPRAIKLNNLAKEFCSYVGWNARSYRKFKSTGEAHAFQRILCSKMYHQLNWNRIPGRALSQLVHGKFLKAHGLEDSYTKWIMKQPVAKFTGYIYELGAKVKEAKTSAQILTLDKQFLGLVATNNPLTASGRRPIVAIDCSGSMYQPVKGLEATPSIQCVDIAKAMGVYFANLLQGAFNKWTIKFSEKSSWVKLNGGFCEQLKQISWNDMPGNTDFLSIIDSFVYMRKKDKSIPETDFPNSLLVVSDMQFDDHGQRLTTTYEEAKRRLRAGGFSEAFVKDFQFIWWRLDARCSKVDFPQTLSEPGGYFLSGFDGAIVSLFLNGEKIKDEKTGKLREKTMEEKMQDALTQEVLLQVNI